MADPFWECALNFNDDGKEWITAHGEQQGDPFCESQADWNEEIEMSQNFNFPGIPSKEKLDHSACLDTIEVRIREMRGSGVFDSIGGELWEAALLLCAELITCTYKEEYIYGSVLELGSGVGLCGFFLLQLKMNIMDDLKLHASTRGEICMTDYDHRVLRNLRSTLETLRCIDSKPSSRQIDSFLVNVSVKKFDWFYPAESLLGDSVYTRFDYVIGSDLVYNNEHALALSEIIYILLTANGAKCKAVTIIQMKDRPGFDRFLLLLNSKRGLSVSVESISPDLYLHAQSMKCSLATLSTRGGRDISAYESEGQNDEYLVEKVVSIPLSPRSESHLRRSPVSIVQTSAESFAKVIIRKSE